MTVGQHSRIMFDKRIYMTFPFLGTFSWTQVNLVYLYSYTVYICRQCLKWSVLPVMFCFLLLAILGRFSELYSEPYETSKIELFGKIVNGLKQCMKKMYKKWKNTENLLAFYLLCMHQAHTLRTSVDIKILFWKYFLVHIWMRTSHCFFASVFIQSLQNTDDITVK